MPPVLPPSSLRKLGLITGDTRNQLQQFASRQGLEARVGPPGAQGPPATTYTFTEGAASATWTIKHELKRFPSVTVVDTAADEVEGAVEYVNENELKIVFSAAVTGTAYLN